MWIPVLTDSYFYPSLNSSWSDTTEIPAKIENFRSSFQIKNFRSDFQIFSHLSWHNIMQISDCALFGSKVRDYPTSAGCQDRRLNVPGQELLHKFQSVWQNCCYFSCWLIVKTDWILPNFHPKMTLCWYFTAIWRFFCQFLFVCLFVLHIPNPIFLLLNAVHFEEALSAVFHIFSQMFEAGFSTEGRIWINISKAERLLSGLRLPPSIFSWNTNLCGFGGHILTLSLMLHLILHVIPVEWLH